MKRIPAVGIVGCLLTLTQAFTLQAAGAPAGPTDLRCEYLADPLGIDVVQPRLNWRLEWPERGARQSAFRVLVASSPDLLAKEQGDLWDSGKVESDQSILVEYAGSPLRSGRFCYWKVRAWNAAGRPSSWSKPARWSMGLLNPADWKAKWIGRDGGEEAVPDLLATHQASWIWLEAGAQVRAPAERRYFRRRFVIPAGRQLRSALCQMAGDDGFTLWINGVEAGAREGHPNVLSVDATPMLQAGENVLAVAACNKPGPPENPAGLIGALRLEFAEGDSLVVVTDGQWQASAANTAGWARPGFEASAWPRAAVLGKHGLAPWGQVSAGQEHRRLAGRMLRREFSLDKQVARATAYVCGLGFFELHLNGRKVGDHVMDPVLSHYGKRAFYVTFDVTSQLRRGRNAVGVLLGNGRFFAPRIHVPTATPTFGYPKLLLQMEVEYADGSRETLGSDESWRITDRGPIRANNEFDGEEYDARLEQAGWAEAGLDDSRWERAHLVQAPGGKLMAQMLEPMRVTQVLRPVAITQPKPGVYLVDFGQNLYGVVRLKVRGPAGTRIQVRTSFTRKPDGTIKMEDNRSALSTDVYVCRGKGQESWAPRFRGQGTHYAEITGWPGVPTADHFELLVVHTDLEQAGEFTCSNELINQIYANVVRGTRMQERGVPLDPDRDERQAWLGHPAKTSESEAHLYGVAAFYRSFLGEIRIDQRADGNLSDAGSIWPFYSGDVIWPSVCTILPDWYYNFYGDRRVLEQNYDTAKRWVQFQQQQSLQPDFTFKPGCYGDWVDASSMEGRVSDQGSTSIPLMSTAYFYHNCRLLVRAARLLGKAEEARYYEALSEKVGQAFNKSFFDPASGTYASKTQCSSILPLAFGLVPEPQRALVVSNLVEDIVVRHGGHLSVGLVGMQWFMQTLTEQGRPDVAWQVATQTTRPSWGYMVAKGGTSIWERWDQDTRDPGMNGESQLILAGNLAAWFYQALAGINYDPERPGFKHVILRPRPVGDLKFVQAWHKCPYGIIRSEWKREKGAFHWDFTIPPNTTATVYVPAGGSSSLFPGDSRAKQNNGLKFIRMQEGCAVWEAVPGRYSLVRRLRSQPDAPGRGGLLRTEVRDIQMTVSPP